MLTSPAKFAIEAIQVSKVYDDFKALDNLSLSIERGEFVTLLGPNGAGKTTFLEICEGIRPPSSGEIRILGREWKEGEESLRKSIGLTFQETRFPERATVWETLELFATFFHLPRSRAEEVLENVQLIEKRKTYIMNLSGGQKQRLAIGIALLHKPELLFLDEPTTGLDPKSRREIWELLLSLRNSNMTLVLTTHYMEEAEALCERLIFLYKGKVYRDGKLKDLVREAGKNSLEELFLSLTGSSLEEAV